MSLRVEFSRETLDAIQFQYINYAEVEKFIEQHFKEYIRDVRVYYDEGKNNVCMSVSLFPRHLDSFVSDLRMEDYIIDLYDYLVCLPGNELGVYTPTEFDIMFNKIC